MTHDEHTALRRAFLAGVAWARKAMVQGVTEMAIGKACAVFLAHEEFAEDTVTIASHNGGDEDADAIRRD